MHASDIAVTDYSNFNVGDSIFCVVYLYNRWVDGYEVIVKEVTDKTITVTGAWDDATTTTTTTTTTYEVHAAPDGSAVRAPEMYTSENQIFFIEFDDLHDFTEYHAAAAKARRLRKELAGAASSADAAELQQIVTEIADAETTATTYEK